MTRVLRGLSGRVFLAAAICAGLSVAVVAVVMTSLFIDQAMKRISARARELQVPWGANVIVGHPAETPDTLERSAKYLRELRGSRGNPAPAGAAAD